MSEFYVTETPWIVVRGAAAGCQVISESAPKTRKNVASVGGNRREQNARLISASPELLEACLRSRNQLYAAGYDSKKVSINPAEELLFQLESAINKALGD